MPPKNITARPTTDFAKESLFNLLTNRMDFDGVDMLDLFAGTGGIGLEFVSRGAREVTAVEMAHTQQNFIISTCKQLGITNLVWSVAMSSNISLPATCNSTSSLPIPLTPSPPYPPYPT